jgi:hypothetical protein
MGSALLASITVSTLLVLLVAFTIKHVVADFFLQTDWMALGKERRKGWLIPLLWHAAWHGALTALLAAAVEPRLVWLGGIDFLVHAAIDRCKGLVVAINGITPKNHWYWWLIGIDQGLHHLIGIAFAIVLASH